MSSNPSALGSGTPPLPDGQDYFSNYDDLLEEIREAVGQVPGHYLANQPLALFREFGSLKAFARCNAVKYLLRYDRKSQPREDLIKAIHYSLMLLRELPDAPPRGEPKSPSLKE